MSLDNLQVRAGWTVLSGKSDGSTLHGVQLGKNAGVNQGTVGGAFYSNAFPDAASADQTVASSGTIAHNGAGTVRCTTGGAVTGVIVAPGTVDGQKLFIINTSANTITMAAAGTSNVGNGTGCIVSATAAIDLTWDAKNARWWQVRAA